MEVRAYVDNRNAMPIVDWVQSLDLSQKKRVLGAIARFEAGNFSDVRSMEWNAS